MAKIKNLLTIILLIGLITIPQVSAFSIFGWDVGEAWHNLWNDDDENVKITVPNEIFNISVDNLTVTNYQAINLVNNNAQVKNILNEIDYDCLYVNTDKNLNISVFFSNHTVTNIAKGKYCEDEIYFEESLIKDLESGFEASKIMTYLDKVEMPMKMYYKLVKAFS